MARARFDPFLRSVSLRADRVPTFDCYPFNIPAVRHLGCLKLHPKVTYFIGENGSGKSTLLEAIAVSEGLNPEGGSRNFNFSTRESHSELWKYLQVLRGSIKPANNDAFILRAESFYNVASEVDRIADPLFLQRNYGGASLHERSHGESFEALLLERFYGNGLYLLDEPESALSPIRQMGLLSIMHGLIEKNSQFVIATHSPIVMAYPEATIYLFSNSGISRVEYEETEHYKVTLAFLQRRRSMLRELLSKDE